MPRSPLLILPGLAAALLLASCERSTPTEVPGSPGVAAAHAPPVAPHVASQTVIAHNLLYPRGIAFGHDGSMYVAEAGTPQGNTDSTSLHSHCTQVPAPVGPYLGGATSRISKFDTHGTRTTLVSGLPSAINAMGDVLGVNDVAFVGQQLYALLNAGCSHGNTHVPASVIRVKADGSWSVVADLSAFLRDNPVAHPEPDDFEPDGTLYSMVASGGTLYAVESNQGNLLSVQPHSGHITRIADVSATEGHVVPTALALQHGSFLVGELTPFPSVPGSANVLSFMRDGHKGDVLGHFTAILGVDTDRHGNVFVLESFTCATAQPCFPSPGSGDIVLVGKDGTRSVIVTGLSLATALRIGPDGALYVSVGGYGPPASGQIIRIGLTD